MKKERKEKHFIKKPIYEGGMKAMKQFIKENLQYPKAALEAKIEGTVALKYTIGNGGKVTEAKIISPLTHGCNEEAIRLVKLLKFKVPKSRAGRVLFHNNIQIHFRLPKVPEKSTNQGTQINYQISTGKKEAPKTTQKKSSYNYTINITKD